MYRIIFTVVIFMVMTLGAVQAQTKPVLYISFDKDFDGAGPEGVVRGKMVDNPEFVSGKFGQALKSGPNTGYVDFPTKGIINPTEGTVEMWVCPLDWTLSDQEFHVFFDVLQGDGRLCLYKFTAKVGVMMLSSEKSVGPNFNYLYHTTWKPGEWHHIAGTWSAKAAGGKPGLMCFIDGKQDYNKDSAEARLPQKLGSTFRIGDSPWHLLRKSSSLVDEVRVYDRALSPAQVAAHAQGNYDYSAPLSIEQIQIRQALNPEKKEAKLSFATGSSDVEDVRLKVKLAILPKDAAFPEGTPDYPLSGGQTEQILPLPSMAPGEYQAAAKLYQDGKEFTEVRSEIIIPDIKKWQGNTIGLEDKVLPPWTPLQLKGKTVSCWGREYVFDDSPLVTRITSAGQELLARPVTLNGSIGGQSVQWKTSVSEGKLSSVGTSFKMDGVLTGTAKEKIIKFKVTNTVEYDGLDLVEVSLQGNAAELDNLTLDIPVHSKNALYRHRYAWNWSKRTSSSLPEEQGVVDNDPFIPYYWLGDNDRGLFWFCESDQMWPNGQNSNAIEIVRQGDVVVLRLNLLASGQKLPPNWNFTFGLQATPVKPLPKDWRKWRLKPGRNANVDIIWPTPGRPDSVKYSGYPEPNAPEPFTDRVNSLHRQNIKATTCQYLTWMAGGCPEFIFFRKPWSVDQKIMDKFQILMSDDPTVLLPIWFGDKDFQDFITWKTKEFVGKYNIDGAYYDNSALSPMEKIDVGVGYACDGKTYPAYPILSQRNLQRRIYSVYKSQPRDTFIIAHMSRQITIPVFAYDDAILFGEQFRGSVKDNYMDLFSLDTFRAEMMGRQWGVIPIFLPEFGGNTGTGEALAVEPTRGLMALLMLHDVPLWPIWCNANVVNQALAALDEFGYEDSEFIGYFDENPPAATDLKDVYVSAYKRPDKKVLLVVSNLSREERKGAVTINAGRIGVQLKKVVSWPDKQPVTITDGKVQVSISGLGYQMLVVTEN